jgi:hypothetical protein
MTTTKSTESTESKEPTKACDIYFEKYRKKSGKERAKMKRYPKWDKRIEIIKETDRWETKKILGITKVEEKYCETDICIDNAIEGSTLCSKCEEESNSHIE